MANTALVGAQWGDEGKGKIIDVLARDVDIVARYQGGNNAGHTVKVGDDDKHVLHLIPSGILHEGKICVIGNGLVVDPLALLSEIGELEKRGVKVAGKLLVSDRAHMILPTHRALDEAHESGQTGGDKIGTTRRGIGPSYSDKASRRGLRMCDMLDPAFHATLEARLDEGNRMIEALGGKALDKKKALSDYTAAASRLAPYIADTVSYLHQADKAGKSILFEGAQGTMLDIDFGTYPFVTSSNATAGGVCSGTGMPPRRIDRVIGVVKAYTTRVGEGPFPTELSDEIGRLLGREGQEFGATTGRPRRCGWFDAVVARHAVMINGIDLWAITKLDVLDSLQTIRICVAYECDGRKYETVPANIRILERCKPVYEEMEGWRSSTKEIAKFGDLPANARAYVERLCVLTETKLGMLSLGPRRESTLRIAL